MKNSPKNFAPARSELSKTTRAFTLVDTLVTLAIVAVLISILLPSLSGVREAARRVACASNVRQIGLGITMYADDNKDYLPPSVFAPPEDASMADVEANPSEMMTMRLAAADLDPSKEQNPWDGVGLLFATDYLTTPKLFYCPSHHGEHPYLKYVSAWMNPGNDPIVSNYHYRGQGPSGQHLMSQIDPASTILLSDGMRLVSDYNHRKGCNTFRADNAVIWVPDPSGLLANMMAQNESDASDRNKLPAQWRYLDNHQGETSGEPPR